MFFSVPSWALALIIFGVVVGAALLGGLIGRFLRERSDRLKEPIGVLQAALLGLVGLILAFGLSLAVGRYEDRRAALVAEANAIATAGLVTLLLLVTFDLDRPTRGLITIPTTPLRALRASMALPPPAHGP